MGITPGKLMFLRIGLSLSTMKTTTRILLLLTALGGLSLFAGCNTTEGVGRDVERTGEEIQDAAR